MHVFIRILFLASCCIPYAVNADGCLRYSGAPISLQGKVTLRTFFGPPDWGETPATFKTDTLETQAILKLDTAICVDADPAQHADAEQDQKDITLVLYHNTKSFLPYVGKHVVVEGSLGASPTGHYHTDLMIEVHRIETR